MTIRFWILDCGFWISDWARALVLAFEPGCRRLVIGDYRTSRLQRSLSKIENPKSKMPLPLLPADFRRRVSGFAEVRHDLLFHDLLDDDFQIGATFALDQ